MARTRVSAQLPVLDDIGLLKIDEKMHGERILCRDLSKFLGISTGKVRAYAREKKILHSFGSSFKATTTHWVTPVSAARIILYFRALQQWKLENVRRRPAATVRTTDRADSK